MTNLQIFILLFIGIGLFMIDVFLVPGMILGTLGIITSLAAVVFAYQEMGVVTGTLMLLGTTVLNLFLVWWGMNKLSKSKMAVREVIDGKVNKFHKDHITIGQVAKTISALRPEGKAIFNNDIYTVWSQIGFIEADREIIVIDIKDAKIFVKEK